MPKPSYITPRRGDRELAFREADGACVRLYRDAPDDKVFVAVRDHRDGNGLVLSPPRHEALSASHHPSARRSFDVPDASDASPRPAQAQTEP